MKAQFIPYKIALKLKELGFDEEVFGYYKEGSIIDQDDMTYERGIHNRITQTYNSGTISAPLWQQAIDWLREKHNLYVQIVFSEIQDESLYPYYYYIIDMKTKLVLGTLSYNIKEFKEAKEQAILKAIELIS